MMIRLKRRSSSGAVYHPCDTQMHVDMDVGVTAPDDDRPSPPQALKNLAGDPLMSDDQLSERMPSPENMAVSVSLTNFIQALADPFKASVTSSSAKASTTENPGGLRGASTSLPPEQTGQPGNEGPAEVSDQHGTLPGTCPRAAHRRAARSPQPNASVSRLSRRTTLVEVDQRCESQCQKNRTNALGSVVGHPVPNEKNSSE